MGAWALCIGLALLELWFGRYFVSPDGISYLDMSDALALHHWHMLVNPLWSPLYPFLIGITAWLVHPSVYWEVPMVHLLNFGIFLGALASFEFFLNQFTHVLEPSDWLGKANSAAQVPIWIWQLLGYSLFAWSTLAMIQAPRMTAPDLCVATVVYLDSGLLLKLRTNASTLRTSMLLGLTLGLGYLAKAFLFPMAFLFIAAAFFTTSERRRAMVSVAIISIVFCAVATPLFLSISQEVGRLSFSEAGDLNYAWHVNGEDKLRFYSSAPPPYLKHPMELLHSHPAVFGFAQPVASTYSPWFDPYYWNAGTKRPFNLQNQLRAIGTNLAVFFTSPFIVPMWSITGVGLILAFLSSRARQRLREILKIWQVPLIGVSALCAYLLVWIEPRYVAPFLVLVVIALFPGIFLRQPTRAAGRVKMGAVIVSTLMMALTALYTVYHLTGFHRVEAEGGYAREAIAVHNDGIRTGDAVALIGDARGALTWARLARLRIVAQIPPGDADVFWQASDPRIKGEVYRAFVKAGAKAVITTMTPPARGFEEWQRVGTANCYLHLLAPSPSN